MWRHVDGDGRILSYLNPVNQQISPKQDSNSSCNSYKLESGRLRLYEYYLQNGHDISQLREIGKERKEMEERKDIACISIAENSRGRK